MTAATLAPPAPPDAPTAAGPNYDNAAEAVHALGGVPLSRILWNPRPGTATDADQRRYCEGAGVGKRAVELVDGVLVEKPVGNRENYIASWIHGYLLVFTDTRGLGRVGGETFSFRTTPTRSRCPDVFFTSHGLVPRGAQAHHPAAYPPELAVEVLSPDNTRPEMGAKRREYFAAGCRLYWEIDPVHASVIVYTNPDAHDAVLNPGDTLDGAPVLPGFTLSVSRMFHYLDDADDQPEPTA